LKPADLVTFATEVDSSGNVIKCDIGLLIKYEKWEKIAYILYDRKIYKVHGAYARKAGKNSYKHKHWKTRSIDRWK